MTAVSNRGSVSGQCDRVLVRGLYNAWSPVAGRTGNDRAQRARAFTEHAATLGLISYEWVDGRGRGLANRLLRWMRGTAPPVDAVEIMAIDEAALRRSLAGEIGRSCWHRLAGCEAGGHDAARSFLLIGSPIRHVEGGARGQRLLWFGNGLGHLSRAEFVEHYTTRHGPLVAGHAQAIGLRSYRQVPAVNSELCDSLRELGLGQAPSPAVFAELVVGTPPLRPSIWRTRRAANRQIEADERRHIDFAHSMLLLAA